MAKRRWEKNVRFEVISHYGGECRCCGEQLFEFLTVYPKASAEKQPARKNVFLWLRQQNFPPNWVVLCWNCFKAYDSLGFCPHRDSAI